MIGLIVAISYSVYNGRPPATDDTPSLGDAAAACGAGSPYVNIGDDGRTLEYQGEGEEASGAPFSELLCNLDALNVTDAVVSHIKDTRALDGMQSDSWSDYSARWTYHPNNGVNMTITSDQDS